MRTRPQRTVPHRDRAAGGRCRAVQPQHTGSGGRISCTSPILDPDQVVGFCRADRAHSSRRVGRINLAREIHAELILLDDRAARKVAISAGLSVIGLLGVLERAAERNMLDLAEVAGRLPADYRIDQRLVVAAVRRANEQRERPTNP